MVEKYLSCNEVIREFLLQYPHRRPPTSRTILYNVRKFRQHHTCLNRNQFNSGRLRTAGIPENIELVRQAILENPNVSIRRNGTGLTKTNFNLIARLNLNLHSYQMIRMIRRKMISMNFKKTISKGELIIASGLWNNARKRIFYKM